MTDHERFRMLAAQRLDGTLTADEVAELEGHFATCGDCRREALAMARDHRLVTNALEAVPVSPRVRANVLAAAQGRREQAPWRLLAAAALLVLGGLGVAALAGSRPSQPPAPSGGATHASASPTASPAATPSASPTAPTAGTVNGAYAYSVSEAAQRRDSVNALAGDPPSGTWSRLNMVNDASLGGTLTCVVIDGSDAWMAGPATFASDGSTDKAALLFVHDGGGVNGAGDTAVTWITDPGQTLETMQGWCRDRYTPAEPYPLDDGDIIVRDSP
jgi:hypothetical protein